MASLGDTLEEYGQIIVKQLQDKIAEKKLIGGGILYQSIKYSVKIFGKDYILHIGFNNPADDYAKFADEGRKGGKPPPVEAIDKWLFKKGILPKEARKGTLKQKLAARKGLAFVIAKSIAKKGTIKRFGYKGSKFWTEVINDDLKKELTADLRKALKRDILIEFGELKKEIKSHG